MPRIAISCLILLFISTSLSARNDLEIPEFITSIDSSPEPSQKMEPIIRTQFFTAATIEALPKLAHLKDKDPEYNKILLKFDGFPANQELIFELKRLAGKTPNEYEQISTLVIQNDGSLLVNNETKLKSYVVSSKGFLPGERVTYRLRSPDSLIESEVSGIPTPAIFKDNDGNTAMKAELISITPTVYLIDLPTMTEGEKYDLKSVSIGEIIKAKPIFSANKPFHYLPATRAKNNGGEGFLEIKRKNKEKYYLILPWGIALDEYLSGNRIYSTAH